MKYWKLISKLTKKKDNTGYIAVALVAGLAAGAVLSLLFAPERGSKTRKIIGDKALDIADTTKDRYASLKNKIKESHLELEDEVAAEIPHFIRAVPKKKKSDIAEIVNDSHV